MDNKTLQVIFYSAFALLAIAACGIGLANAQGEGLAFAFCGVMTIGGALICVWERSVVRSAFALMGTFLGVAGLFLLLESDFLAMAQVLIYVGGILALILFGVMLSPPDLKERSLPRLFGGIGLVGAAVAWVGFKVAATAAWATNSVPGDGRPPRFDTADQNAEGAFDAAEMIGVGFLAPEQYVVAFELAAVVLTVALVAAVYIARRKQADLDPRTEGEVS
jgi:NADH:ubiquinone oxidoreductase subunit 6 (subunit J)